MSHIQLNTPGRNRLPDRRASVTFAFECNALAYSATISRYPNGGKPSSPLGAALDLVADMLGGRPMTLTSSSSLVLPFVQKFEAWREAWHRQVLADRQLGHRDKSVAGFLLWYLKSARTRLLPVLRDHRRRRRHHPSRRHAMRRKASGVRPPPAPAARTKDQLLLPAGGGTLPPGWWHSATRGWWQIRHPNL